VAQSGGPEGDWGRYRITIRINDTTVSLTAYSASSHLTFAGQPVHEMVVLGVRGAGGFDPRRIREAVSAELQERGLEIGAGGEHGVFKALHDVLPRGYAWILISGTSTHELQQAKTAYGLAAAVDEVLFGMAPQGDPKAPSGAARVAQVADNVLKLIMERYILSEPDQDQGRLALTKSIMMLMNEQFATITGTDAERARNLASMVLEAIRPHFDLLSVPNQTLGKSAQEYAAFATSLEALLLKEFQAGT
jgi:hypothetical protein